MQGKICSKCHIEKSINLFHKNKNESDGLHHRCKQCCKEHSKIYTQKYDITHRNEKKIVSHQHRLTNRYLVFKYYGQKCAHCGIADFDCLSIDHINGGGSQHVKQINHHLYSWLIQNNYPDGFQTLCMNCQRIKVIENQEACKKQSIRHAQIRKWHRNRTKKIKLYYGGCCSICKCNDWEVLEFDHVNNNGGEFRKNNNIYNITQYLNKYKLPTLSSIGLQLLCANCNHKKEKTLKRKKIC